MTKTKLKGLKNSTVYKTMIHDAILKLKTMAEAIKLKKKHIVHYIIVIKKNTQILKNIVQELGIQQKYKEIFHTKHCSFIKI